MLVLPAIAKQTLECRQDADLAADAMVLGEHPGLEKQYVVAAVRIHRTVTEHQDDLPQAIAIISSVSVGRIAVQLQHRSETSGPRR